MGKTIKQWRTIIKKMSTNSLRVLNDSFLNIMQWKEFTQEYDWTGWTVIAVIIRNELKDRKQGDEKNV